MANQNLLAQIAGGAGYVSQEQRAQSAQRGEQFQWQREDRQRQTNLLKAFPAAVGGDQNALAAVAQSDPQTFMGLQTHHAKLAETQRKQAEARLQQFSQAALYGLDSVQKAPEAERQAAYEQIIGRVAELDPEAYQKLGGAPQQYDPAWVRQAQSTLLPMAMGQEKFSAFLAERQKQPEARNLQIEEIGVDGGMFQKVQMMADGTTKPLGKPYRKAADAGVDLRRDLADEKRQAQDQKIADSVSYTSDLIDQMIGADETQPPHPGLSAAVGAKGATALLNFGNAVPGTDAANFESLFNQIRGRQFLEAFQSLKGGGQITQIEGEKATQAISRMSLAQSEAEFVKAAREFQSVINSVKERRAVGQTVGADPNMPKSGGWSIKPKAP